MFEELRASINNPFDFRNFYVLFAIISAILLFAIVLIAAGEKNLISCYPSALDFSGKLDSGQGKTHQFTYNGSTICSLIISPNWVAGEELSVWIYKPDNSVFLVNQSGETGQKVMAINNSQKGTYRISIHNNNEFEIFYQVELMLVPNRQDALAGR